MRTLPIVRRISDLRSTLAEWRNADASIGLVPTMGALHAGHIALVNQARSENTRVVATIFVNPTQFGPNEDLSAYPRNETDDVGKLLDADCDLLFAPDVREMYPCGFSTSVAVDGLTTFLCGATRPGHFGGVATIVTKLLLQALPDRAYFGEKDFQQLQVIKRLARDLDISTCIVGVPTMREVDGLAMSSRNRYLTAAEREIAATLPRVLREVALVLASGMPAAGVLQDGEAALREAGFARIDYLALCDEESLQPTDVATPGTRLFGAGYVGRTRLIDNWPVA